MSLMFANKHGWSGYKRIIIAFNAWYIIVQKISNDLLYININFCWVYINLNPENWFQLSSSIFLDMFCDKYFEYLCYV